MDLQATSGAGIITASVSNTSNALIKIWTVVNSAGVQRVVIIHKDPSEVVPAAITVYPGSKGVEPTASLARLIVSGGNVSSTHGISLGGITWDGSLDGSPQGTPVTESVPFVSGVWEFSITPGSAAILTIPA